MVTTSEDTAQPLGARPGTVLLLAVWIGLIAGFLDLGLVIINNPLIGRTFYRLSGDFAWLIPSGVTALVLVPGILIALYVKARGPAVSAGMAEGLLFFVGFLDVCARLPLHIWASLLICGGLATQSVRLMRRRRLGVPTGRAPHRYSTRRKSCWSIMAGDDRRTRLVGTSCDVRLAARAAGCQERALNRVGYSAGW